MSNSSRKNVAFRLMLFSAVCIVTLVACWAQSRPGESELVLRRFATGMVDATDLPFGWGGRESSSPDRPGSVGQSISYYGAGPGVTHVNVRHRLFVYPTEEASAAGYEQAVAESIPPAYSDKWVAPPELQIESQADQFIARCLPAMINGAPAYTCVVIGQYGAMLSELSAGTVRDPWLNMSQFRRVVERVDAKMYQASQLQPVGP